MDVDQKYEEIRQPAITSQPNTYALQPMNAMAGPSSVSEPPMRPHPPIYLPQQPEQRRPRSYFDSTQDLLSRFQLLSAYDKYVRPYSAPVGTSNAVGDSTLAMGERGKGKEKEVFREVESPGAAQTPGAGVDGDDDESPVMGEKKWKNNYKHLIKGVPGKHSMKKDDYLMNMIEIPPKQRLPIHQFDLRTQRDAFSVSLEGLKGWNINALVAESPQAREDRKRRKELKKMAKTTMTATSASTPIALPLTSVQTSVVRTNTPRPGAPSTARAQPSVTQQRPQTRGLTPVGVGTPRPTATQDNISSGQPQSMPGRHTPIPTPAPTPGSGVASNGPFEAKRGLKREREESTDQPSSTNHAAVTVVTNGPVKPAMLLNAKAGNGGVRPRPLKKPRTDSQGQLVEIPIQQPTPRA